MTTIPSSSPRGDILVVDDHPDNLTLLTQLLARHGYQVRVAPSGRLALQSAQAERPDLILLDIRMPEMDGYQVCAQLKAAPRTTDIPIIFLSALNDTDDKLRAFAAGGINYLTKPFDEAAVLEQVELELRQRRNSEVLRACGQQ